MFKTFRYKNCQVVPSKKLNIIAGGNGSGKSVMMTGMYQFLRNGYSDLVSDVSLQRRFDEIKVYYIQQDEMIFNKDQIEQLIKEHTEYNFVKGNIEASLKNLHIEETEESLFKLNVISDKVRNNLQKFKDHKKLLQEKENIENYMRSKESRKLCNKIIEIQDKIAQEEVDVDNFENAIVTIQKEKLEKEIQDLKHQIANEHNIIERKKILWREESKIKESVKKHRHHRRVIDLIEFEEEITEAVIAVFGNRLKAKVVQYEDEALEEIKNLKFRQTYLVMEKLATESTSAEIQKSDLPMLPMNMLLKTKAEFNKLKEFLCKDIYVVEDIDTPVPGKILVTLSGQVLHKDGSVTGGYEENRELKTMFKEKEIYKQGIQRLKEIEKELKRVTDSSVADTKGLINKIIAEKEEQLKKITISKSYINLNLEKLKILLSRLIDQKKAIKVTNENFETNSELESKNLHEELGRINREMKGIMVSRKIDYEDIGNRIDELFKKNKELEEQKKQMIQIANELEEENENNILKNMKQISDRVLYFYNQINGDDFNESETDSKTSSPELAKTSETKENFQNLMLSKTAMAEPNPLFRKISTLSGGQLQILALSLMFSINEIANFDVILLDEIDSNLDESKIPNLYRLFNQMRSQIFQISHRKGSLNAEKCFWVTKENVEEITDDELQSRLA